METQLRNHLVALAHRYAATKKAKLTTVGRLAAGDWRFFTRLDGGSASFTARKYDEVVRWFDGNWPDDLDWPEGVIRPEGRSARNERGAAA